MTLFTLPTSRPVTQDWAQDFMWLNGTYYPNGFYSSLGWKGHNGIDYGCFVGDPVEAVCDGVIEYVGPGNNHTLLSGGGNVILLRNDELGMRFEYLHLSQQNVYTTQRVTRGQVIGLSGNTGVSTASHLHLGAIPVGNVNQNDGWRGRVDPTPYLYGPMNPDYSGVSLQGSTITVTPPKPEGFLMALDDEAQNNIYKAMGRVDATVAKLAEELAKVSARVFGRDVQRWYHPDNPGDVRTYAFEGSVSARSTDVNDVLSTNRIIEANTNKILTALSGLPGIDANVIAGLREQLAAELKSATESLSVTLTVKDEK